MKKRSASYPSKSLQECEAFAVSVFEKVGDAVLDYAELAKQGNVPVREADSFASTSNQYGWMTQVRGKGYSPKSEICKALRTPHDEAEKNRLYISAFMSPPLYQIIINQWSGKKVTEEGLKISLIRDQEFSDAGSVSAARVFIENARFLGLLDLDGVFNEKADIVITPEVIKDRKVKSPSTTTNKKPSEKTKPKQEEPYKYNGAGAAAGGSGATKKISIFVRGQELHLAVLEDMNQSDWDAVIKQIQNIKSFSR